MATILIIDDEAIQRRALSAMLKLEGYRILEAFSGQYALGLLEKELPDLILLDLRMPEMDGYDVFNHLKSQERTRNIPILVVSAMASQWDIDRAAKSGLVRFVTKPFHPDDLFTRVEEALSAGSTSEE